MTNFAKIAKALGDEGRVRLMCALDKEKELCACQLTELLALAPSTLSKHLGILKQAGLLRSRREVTWIYYTIDHGTSDPLARAWIDFTVTTIRHLPEYSEVKQKLRSIKKLDLTQLCCKQRARS